MTILCLDYGRVHLGLAFASGPLAQPLFTLPTNQVDQRLSEILTKYQITHLLVGVSSGKMAQESRQFGHRLSKLYQLPVMFHDEAFTSRQVAAKLTEAKPSLRRGPDHHFAAALILQDYLDENHV